MTKLAIGPANYAGQAHAWVTAVRTHSGIDSRSFAYRSRPFGWGPGPAFTFPSDLVFPHPRTMTPLGRRWRLHEIAKFTHVMLDGFVPIRHAPGEGVDDDVHYLSERATAVGLISHGSDLRHPDQHRELFAHSYFDHADAEWIDLVRRQVVRNQATLRANPDIPLFVSTPDLLLHQPGATWLPLCVASGLFTTPVEPRFERRTPIVLHIPSRRNPPIKGTHLIDPVIKRLEAQGALRYVSPEGVSHGEMIRLISEADIVIDQILTGAYGVTAVEAMSLGALVIGGISKQVRSVMPQSPPIVNASPDDLGEVLSSLLLDREDAARIALQGPEFARSWHDGRASAAAIANWVLDH